MEGGGGQGEGIVKFLILGKSLKCRDHSPLVCKRRTKPVHWFIFRSSCDSKSQGAGAQAAGPTKVHSWSSPAVRSEDLWHREIISQLPTSSILKKAGILVLQVWSVISKFSKRNVDNCMTQDRGNAYCEITTLRHTKHKPSYSQVQSSFPASVRSCALTGFLFTLANKRNDFCYLCKIQMTGLT